MADRSSSQPGTPGGSSSRSRPSPTSTPDGRVEHRLRHRPRQQRGVAARPARADGRSAAARRRSAPAAAARPGRRRRRRSCRSAPRRRRPRRRPRRDPSGAGPVGHVSVGQGTPAGWPEAGGGPRAPPHGWAPLWAPGLRPSGIARVLLRLAAAQLQPSSGSNTRVSSATGMPIDEGDAATVATEQPAFDDDGAVGGDDERQGLEPRCGRACGSGVGHPARSRGPGGSRSRACRHRPAPRC